MKICIYIIYRYTGNRISVVNTLYSRRGHIGMKTRLGAQTHVSAIRAKMASGDVVESACSSVWSQSLACVPRITTEFVDKWADNEAKIPKSKQTKGYSNWLEGYIHDVEGSFVTVTVEVSKCKFV